MFRGFFKHAGTCYCKRQGGSSYIECCERSGMVSESGCGGLKSLYFKFYEWISLTHLFLED